MLREKSRFVVIDLTVSMHDNSFGVPKERKIYMNYPLEPFQIRGYRLKGYLFSSEILSILFQRLNKLKTFLERVLKG